MFPKIPIFIILPLILLGCSNGKKPKGAETVNQLTFPETVASERVKSGMATVSLYLGQEPPKDIPKIFAPGIISLPDRNEEVITFSSDGTEIYYSIEFYPEPEPSFIMYTRYQNGKWTDPDTASFSINRRTSEPFMAFEGSRIYYFANNIKDQKGALDICYSYRKTNGWSAPISLSAPPNFKEPGYTLHPCITADSSIYFSSYTGQICKSEFKQGKYQNTEILPSPINYQNIEGEECWGDPFVSPKEEYMIFRSNRMGGYGGSDLYITFNMNNGQWSQPKNLGEKINSNFDELGGDITPDGKYMTFGRDGDIYWVSTDFIRLMRGQIVN